MLYCPYGQEKNKMKTTDRIKQMIKGLNLSPNKEVVVLNKNQYNELLKAIKSLKELEKY